ncbi:MAG: hypothetical protein Q8K78_00750 [Planctomycetaceae bacterium]|nr:hypothetical protein [Planctomycetaceae bacterium]
MPAQPEQEPDRGSFSDSINVLYFLTVAHSTCLTPFLRERFGAEAFGLPGVAAAVLLFTMVGITGSADLTFYGIAWFIMLVVHRVQTLQNRWKGIREHSRYAGFPAATKLCFPFVRDERLLKRLEPLLVAGIGGLLCFASPVVGQFVVTGAGSLAITTVLDQFAHHRRLQQLQDAELEQEVLLADWERQRRSRRGNDLWPM